MYSKQCKLEDAIALIQDGSTVMIGGFGVPGTPFTLIDELVKQGPGNLTIIKNDANKVGMGVDRLIESGQIKRLIVSHIGLNANAIRQMNEGHIEVEFCAQGILAERIRAGGSGLLGFVTDIGMDTELAKGKQMLEVDNKPYLFERAIKADYSLVHADTADPFGNLKYTASAQNFNPIMAMAATTVICEAESFLPLGDIAPDTVQTPGPFVDHIVVLKKLTGDYDVVS